MFDESLATIIFRLINLAALVGLFVYLFKKYMQKGIEASIEHDRIDEINLNNCINEVDHRRTELSKKITAQEKLCTHLMVRVDQWKIAFDKELQEKQCAQHALQQKVNDRAARQTQAVAQEQIMRIVLPHAVEEARKQMATSFADISTNKEFVKDIITHIKRGI